MLQIVRILVESYAELVNESKLLTLCKTGVPATVFPAAENLRSSCCSIPSPLPFQFVIVDLKSKSTYNAVTYYNRDLVHVENILNLNIKSQFPCNVGTSNTVVQR